jgi:diguanylate cyclase (GGDEF)-like protein
MSRSPLTPLRGLLEVTRLVRSVEALPELLDAVARVVAETLDYGTVVVSLYRPAWNDVIVTSVHGADGSLTGTVRSPEECERLLADGSNRFLPMRHTAGHLLGVISVDRTPTGEELDVLVSFADHAALAVQSAQERAEAERHQVALEQLLAVSSRLVSDAGADDILGTVCEAVRDALGFQHVLASLRAPDGLLDVRAAVGWSVEQVDLAGPVYFREVAGLLDPEYEIEGCYLLPNDVAVRRLARESDRPLYESELNGSGRWAWSHHWLLVPLHAEDGEVIGILWADEPDDRLLPSSQRLQALRVFANQAAAAVVGSQYVNELRFLADHDPLTRLLNRRAFVERLDGEVGRAVRYGRVFGLVLCDLDGFKELNDRFGHPEGDRALQTFARVLDGALRKGDDAFRIGGDEFALLLAEATEQDARAVINRIRSKLDGVGASFGVASCPGHAPDAQTLFRLADEALYEAKRSGSGLQFVA